MDPVTRAWYGLCIENELHKNNEQGYEDLFCNVMEALHSDNFQLIKAAGSEGDGKSDGYLVPQKCIFQSYAPSSGFNKTKLLKKIEGDFYGAKSKWGAEMEEWIFVHNDFEGLPKYAHDLISKLKQKNSEINISVWSPNILKKQALALPLDDLVDIFGPAPTLKDVITLTHEPIKTLLRAMDSQAQSHGEVILPVSVDKLEYNDLSSDVEVLLNAGRKKENLVKDLLARWPDPEFGEELAQSFRAKYQELKVADLQVDDIFLRLKAFAGGDLASVANQVSSLAVLSYFFERCDIFENAPEGWSP